MADTNHDARSARATLMAAILVTVASVAGCSRSESSTKERAADTAAAVSSSAPVAAPPNFYLKLVSTEPGNDGSKPSKPAINALALQAGCNKIKEYEKKPQAPVPDSSTLSRIDMQTVEYWVYKGAFKQLTTTERLVMDKETCALRTVTERVGVVGDTKSVAEIDYTNKTIRRRAGAAYEGPVRPTDWHSSEKGTVAGETCTKTAANSGPGRIEFCYWDRVAQWRFGTANDSISLLTSWERVRTEAVTIDLAPVIAADTFHLPSGFEKL